jgi:hypothetical protein
MLCGRACVCMCVRVCVFVCVCVWVLAGGFVQSFGEEALCAIFILDPLEYGVVALPSQCRSPLGSRSHAKCERRLLHGCYKDG